MRASSMIVEKSLLRSLTCEKANKRRKSGENASLEKSRNSLQTGGWHETSFHASL
jgi:hypothetical protein